MAEGDVGRSLEGLKEKVGSALGRPRRWRFLERMPKRSICAEIGVYKGDYTREILRITNPRELHLIDAWWTLGDHFPRPWYEKDAPVSTRWAYEQARKVADERCTFHVGDDLEILRSFPNGYFDWVYLDSSHEYEHTVKELEILRAKMKAGGVISGDDWFDDPEHPFHGISRAVKEFCARYGWIADTSDPWAQWLIRPD